MLRETLNNSVSAEQRIFCPIRAVLKMGNTSSIPAFPKLSSEPKPSAVSSYLIIQSFLRIKCVSMKTSEFRKKFGENAGTRMQKYS